MCVSLPYIDQLIPMVYIWCISGKCPNGHIHPHTHHRWGRRDRETERDGEIHLRYPDQDIKYFYYPGSFPMSPQSIPASNHLSPLSITKM